MTIRVDGLYGDPRGGHIRVFKWPGRTIPYAAFYYAGADGIVMGVIGYGFTVEDAVRDLWGKY